MSFIKTRKKFVSSAIASSLSVVATGAIAQEQATQLPTIRAQATVESVKVDQSASAKIVAPLKDTPKSISVLSQKLLKETNSNTLLEALRNEPGITLGAGEGGVPYTDIPYIRGYNAQSAIYVDGVRNSTTQTRDMFAIEQVEVTKGSNSSIIGASGVGGSVNMIPKVAHAGDEYQGTVAGGTANYKHIMLDANKDLGHGVAGRVIVMGHENEKPGQSDGAEYARVGIAPSITFGLDSPTRATLSYYFLKSNDEPDSGIPFSNPNIPANAPAGTTKGNGKPLDLKQGAYYGWKNRDFDKRENHIGTLKLEHDLNDDLTLRNIASYNHSEADYIFTNPDSSQGNIYSGKVWRRATQSIRETEGFSNQLSLAGKFDTGAFEHSFNIGTEYSHDETERGTYSIGYPGYTGTVTDGFNKKCTNIDSWCTSLTNPNSNDPWLGTKTPNKGQRLSNTETVGIYALDSIELNKYWLVNLGLRWDQFNTELDYKKDFVSGSTTIPAGTKFKNDTDFFSYNIGVVFRPTENGSIYTSFATSANPVGSDVDIDGLTALNKALDPEEARTFEIGTKWDLWNKRANLTAAVFRTEKQNTRVNLDANTAANVGESKVDGFEIGLKGHLTDKWEMVLGYSYLDSEVEKSSFNTMAQENRPLPFVAKNSANLWTTYQVLPKLTLGAGVQYRDQVYAHTTPTTATTSTKILPAFTIYNAMAKYEVNKNVNLQLNVNNISDKRYFISAHGSATGAHFANEGDGRNAVLALNFKY